MSITNYQKQEVFKKELPQLIKQSSTYKMIIPRKVEEKIRYLCHKFPTLEWSGVLFTSYKGKFEDGSLVITCEDIYPMDLGSPGFTEFKMDETVATYMAENIELFDCDCQLIHSHNQMSSFFSGQDQTTLREEGSERNCFVSLIVNNAGNYCAAVTRKLQTKNEVTVKPLGTSYEFFGEGSVCCDSVTTSTKTEIIDKEVIEYFMLDIEKEEVENHLAWLDDRFDEIQKKKIAAKPLVTTKSTSPWWGQFVEKKDDDENDFYHWRRKETASYDKPENNIKKSEESYLWDDDTMKDSKKSSYTPDPVKVHAMVVKLVLCSLIVDPAKIDLKQWITRHMKKKYDGLFTQDMSFDGWCDFALSYLFDEYTDPEAPAEFYADIDELNALLAEAMIDELNKYPSNDYIDLYTNVLNRYLDL